MHYEETRVWDTTGRFSGTVVGVDGDGLGLGYVSGSHTQHGRIATKRADTFSEPSPTLKPVFACIVAAGFAAAVIGNAPDVVGFFSAQVAPDQDSSAVGGAISSVLGLLKYIVPFAGLALLYNGYKRATENAADNERTVSNFSSTLERYNELQYCAACNLLYDARGNSAMGNRAGFEALLAR